MVSATLAFVRIKHQTAFLALVTVPANPITAVLDFVLTELDLGRYAW